MLTKSDLDQIDKVVTKRIQEETRKIVKEELAPVKKDITSIRKDIKTIVGYFDNEYLELRTRIERLEEHLNLPPISN